MHRIWLVVAGMLLVFSGEVMEAARKSMQIFAHNVLPALFPMMVLGGLAGNTGSTPRGRSVFLILFGFCAGSPASARQIAIFHKCSPFSRKQLPVLLCMCGVMSPMFFTGSLAARLGSQKGWLMLLAHWAGALVTGGLCHLLYTYRKSSDLSPCTESIHAQAPEAPARSGNGCPLQQSLPHAIAAAAQSLLSVLGAMVLFGIIAGVIQQVGVQLFPVWQKARLLPALLHAALEVGGGSFALLDVGAPPWLLCALCSFGGLSIWLQNLLFLSDIVRPAELLYWRMLHGALSGLFCFGLCSG